MPLKHLFPSWFHKNTVSTLLMFRKFQDIFLYLSIFLNRMLNETLLFRLQMYKAIDLNCYDKRYHNKVYSKITVYFGNGPWKFV